MPIFYTVVSRGDSVLAHHASTSGNFVTYTTIILPKISASNVSQATYTSDRYLFHFIQENGLIFLCLTDSNFERSTALALLLDIQERFVQRYPEDTILNANAFDLNNDFSRILSNQMDYYGRNPQNDKMNIVKQKFSDVRQQNLENIEKLLRRNDHIEILVGGTEVLHEQVSQFNKNSGRLRDRMRWFTYRRTAAIVVSAIFIFYILFL